METYNIVVSDIRVVSYNAIADTDKDIIINSSGLNPSRSSPAWAQRQTYPIQSQVTVKLVANVRGNSIAGDFIILPVTVYPDDSPDPSPIGVGKLYLAVVTETRLAIYTAVVDDQSQLIGVISQLNPYNVDFPTGVNVIAAAYPINTRVVEIFDEMGRQLVLN